MQTLWSVAKVELLLFLRDRRLWVVAAGFWIMLATMLVISQSRFIAEQKQLRAAQETARQQWQSRTGRSGHALGHYGTYAYRAANPLALLHPGAESYVGVAAHIVAHQQTNMFYRPMLDRPSLDRWADASAATLLQVVVPLLLFLLTFASISGDREDGRLKLVLGQGLSPTIFALGKLAGVTAVAVVLLVPAFSLVVVLMVQCAYALGETRDLLPRLLTLFAGYGALYLFFLAAGLAISAWCSTRQSALLVCVGLWAVLCLAAPRLLTVVAETRFPTPEEDVVQEQITEERKDRKAMRALRARVEADALRRYGVKRKEDLPVSLDALQLQAGEEHANSIHDRHMGKIWAQFASQERWVAGVSGVLTPTVSLRNLGDVVSNTDAASVREYVFAIEHFRRDWVRRLNAADAARPRGRRGDHRATEDNHEHNTWADFPAFSYQAPTLATLQSQILWNLGLLWAWAGISVLFAITSVKLTSGANRALR